MVTGLGHRPVLSSSLYSCHQPVFWQTRRAETHLRIEGVAAYTHPPTQTHTHTLLWAYSRKPPNFSTLLVLSANADRLLSQLGSKALWAEMNNFPVKQLHVFIMLPCPVVPTYCIHLAYWKKTSSYIKFIGVFFGSKGGLPNNVGANAGFGFEQGESKTQHSTWVVLNKQFS